MGTLRHRGQLRENGSSMGKGLKHSSRETGGKWGLLEEQESEEAELSAAHKEEGAVSSTGTSQACVVLVDEEIGAAETRGG